MNRDFTLDIYKKFLSCIKRNGYAGVSYLDYIQAPRDKQFIIRHDVDKLPKNSITTAIIESEFDLKGTYYFRIVPDSFDVEALKIIASHGHEIGYHYEDLSLCNGDKEKAIKHFEISLNELRKYVEIKTICMHGSPLSKYDNKSLWTEYYYKDYDIIAEPYIDIDFNKVFYLSDTGRSWNSSINIRDHVNTLFNLKINYNLNNFRRIASYNLFRNYLILYF